MNEATLVALSIVIFGWAVLSEWFAARNLTGPLVFLVAGLLLANSSWGIVSVDIESSTVHHLAEITLALLLFADASTVPLAAARHDLPLTARLLGIGLPLSILAGTALAVVLFPSLPLALAGLIAASLAPTDAALSASVIADERLPIGVRRVLNVESGLNDGIATPVVTFCIAAAATVLGVVDARLRRRVRRPRRAGDRRRASAPAWPSSAGACSRSPTGAAGCSTARDGWRRWRWRCSRSSSRRRRAATRSWPRSSADWSSGRPPRPTPPSPSSSPSWRAACCRWSCGSSSAPGSCSPPSSTSTPASCCTPSPASRSCAWCRWRSPSSASGQDRATIAFVGWFGPRGLASVVFALLAVEELGSADPRVVTAVDTIAVTIVLSVVAHGITARPLATRYVGAPLPTAGPIVVRAAGKQ